MQDLKLPVTQRQRPSKLEKALASLYSRRKKTHSIKILGLLASVGATVSLTQPAQARATVLNDRGETTVALLPSLDASQKISSSVALNNLSTIDSQSSTVSIKHQLKRSPSTETIPQLPALEVARVKQPEAERIHTVKAGETIAKIARQYGVSIRQITEANQLTNPNFVSIDRQLVIPNSELARGVSNNTKSEAISAQGGASLISDSTKPLTSFAEKKAELRNQKKTAIDNSSSDLGEGSRRCAIGS